MNKKITAEQQLKNLEEARLDIQRAIRLIEINILETNRVKGLKMKEPITKEKQKETDRKIDIDLGLAFTRLDLVLTKRQENQK